MKVKEILIFLTFVFSSISLAIDENKYEEQYQEHILPLIKKMEEGYFRGENKVKIHYRTYLQEGAKNCLVILPGRSEPVEKYAEVVYDLLNLEIGKNLNFYLLDHRGQGSSDRMKMPNDMGYVDQFRHYVLDLEYFVINQKLESKCEKKFLLAHSLGAGVATAFMLRNLDFFNKVALTSPMLKIMTKPYPYPVARAIVQTAVAAGRGAKFAVKQKGFNPDIKFEDNAFTTSLPRFKMAMSTYEMFPKTKLGGVSNRWVLEIMKGTNKIRSHYHEITTPIRVFHAGIETYSEPSEMIKFCDEVIKCKRTFFPTSKHEVLMDCDETRKIILESLGELYN